ncbi:methyl-accepting chemotaxis protein [Veronia pacifica]|uniref:Chemotaxis protein n=1 Tax=Veronia pacifica TaxID=1080227 RepID=A0A1C3ESD3_9GAMM|nr:methyl-accepting chemotaxis protein [Veronia pacifica]ODA36125.1 chemotaxis protein [Veronia pacifica]
MPGFWGDLFNTSDKHYFSEAKVEALSKSQAVIEFKMDGTIIDANENFLNAMGYELSEIKGKHHSMFVDPEYAKSEEYNDFWALLRQGKFQSAEFPRLAKGNRPIWIQATYNPLRNRNGQLARVVKFATDITDQKLRNADFSGQIEAIHKSQAVIEFELDGTIITANQNFLSTVGYSLEEIQGKHHSMFVETQQSQSAEYKRFWQDLGSGQFMSGEFHRVGKGGKEIWIQASYNPIFDMSGKPFKVVKFASDITQQKIMSADYSGQIQAISKSQAVIEFELDGTIKTANENFLGAVGYDLEEIQGKHHRMFVEKSYRESMEYKDFWKRLGQGEFQAGEYKRINKAGQEIWIQASYNPIMDASGKPFKVVKYATDITEQMVKNADFSGQIEAIGKSQAVIEFNMDGTIRHANENFLATVGYSSDEIVGRHHSMFVGTSHANSPEYKAFWQKLNRGEFESGEFQRYGKGGKEIWIQASYNPIVDVNGKPFKVVKYASDITAKKVAVSRISDILMSLSKGDLTQSIDEQLDREFEPVRAALNSTISRLNELVTDINQVASSVSSASKEIKTGTIDLSERTETQSASLEETSASMQELTATVSQSADNAQQANELSGTATDKAERGGRVVTDAVNAMSEIETSSKEISDIIGVINEIAFQTNLLALNAAVEAARAGEQGRGFAVVAGEVRNLAQRSAKASVEIKELINKSVSKVKDGTHLVRESGDNLLEIVDSIKEVSSLIATINGATKEQTQGIAEINKSISEMDEMTQQNSGLAEETTASSENLAIEAENLLELIEFFTTKAKAS